MSDEPDCFDVEDWAMEGSTLSPEAAYELEQQVSANPSDTESRIRLLGFYFLNRKSPEAIANRIGHVLWFIRNLPDHPIAGSPWADDHPPHESYEETSKAWKEQISNKNKSPQVLMNAAKFFFTYDKTLAESLLNEGKQLDPINDEWTNLLAFLFEVAAEYAADRQQRVTNAGKALKQLEVDVAEKAFDNLGRLARLSLMAEDFAAAKAYAEQLLEEAPSHKASWNYGNAIHDGNIVLGKLALKNGDVKQAAACLTAAGKTPGSPQLNSFGPDWDLAGELLTIGSKTPVLRYLRQCRRFWETKNDLLDKWQSDIKQGVIPDFQKHY